MTSSDNVVRRYRSKPIEIEAVQLTRTNFVQVGEWAAVRKCWGLDAPSPALHIETPEGMMLAKLGDYVIRGTEGEFYPCKASVFARKYERAATTPKES